MFVAVCLNANGHLLLVLVRHLAKPLIHISSWSGCANRIFCVAFAWRTGELVGGAGVVNHSQNVVSYRAAWLVDGRRGQ